MKKSKIIMFVFPVLSILLFGLLACNQEEKQDNEAKSYRTVAFVDVNVVPMDSELILERNTVIVRDGIIIEIGPASEIPLPPDALQIDGRDKYLMPGLVDMHVHLRDKDDLLLLIANGVTTVRNMLGNPRHLQFREQIKREELLGPTIITAGRIIDGPGLYNYFVVETAEEAQKEVARQKEAGYDFIKVYNYLSPEAYEGVIAAAKKYHMPVAGHVPIAVGIAGAFIAGQASNEHLRGYIFDLIIPDSPVQPGLDLRSRRLAWNYVDESKFAGLAEATRKAGLWNCPTMVVMEYDALSVDDHAKLLSKPEMRYLTLQRRKRMRASAAYSLSRNFSEAAFETAQQAMEKKRRFIKELHQAGAKLLLGTDTDLPPKGFALHEELRNFVDVGLSPYEAIKTGTSNAAEFLNEMDTFGTVEKGKRADLILIEKDPLENVANIALQAGVMVRGRWIPKIELQRMLEDLAASKMTTIYTADVERIDEIKSIANGNSPQLSPDGKVVYYLGQGPGQEEYIAVTPGRDSPPNVVRRVSLFAVPANGGKSRKLTDRMIGGDFGQWFDLSPDGRTIAYCGHIGEGPNPTPALMTVSTDGGRPSILLRLEEYEMTSPRWSPDGSLLAYTYNMGLYTITAEGGEPKKLAQMFSWENPVQWSPRGEYMAALGYASEGEKNAIFAVPSSGGELRRLTPIDEKEEKGGLEWHPDGQSLTYMYYGSDEIRQAYLDGRPTTKFIDQPDRWNYIGTWGPNGRIFYFKSWKIDEEPGLYVYNSASGNIALFYSPVGESMDPPTWSRDGKTIVWAMSQNK